MWPLRQQQGAAASLATTQPEHLPVEKNLRRMMQFFSLARGNGVTIIKDGVQLVSSGMDFSPFNSAMLAEPLEGLHYRAFEQRLHTAAEFFRERSERWSFWLCDDLIPFPVRKSAKSLLASMKMRQTSEPPGMVTERLAPPSRSLPDDLVVFPVNDAKTRTDFGGLTACIFDLPFSICREVYQNERSWSGAFQGWVGYLRGGEPIASCAVVIQDQTVGVYTVGTLPEFRKRGYSETLMRHVLGEVQQRTGITRTLLQATPAGLPMYQKMGYRKVCQFTIYLSEH